MKPVYDSLPLNGTWEMDYTPEAYRAEALPDFKGCPVEKAVPGYWEDMTDAFALTPFFCRLQINPEYGIQRYPIAGTAPDMALPNITGNFFYRRTVVCGDCTGKAALHFTGVQNAVSLWVNGIFCGRHEGYSEPFEIAVPENALREGENVLTLSVSNIRLEGYNGEPVSGITSRAACECTGGITGEAELRFYRSALRDLWVTTGEDCSDFTLHTASDGGCPFTYTVRDGDRVLLTGEGSGDVTLPAEGLELWSPDHPKLYTAEVCDGERTLTRRFGVRRLTAKGVKLFLNNRPIFLHGITEHCYYPLTVHQNHDRTYYRAVIRRLKELGFNFIRFHTVIPMEEYLEAADELGILMHIESPNNTTYTEWEEIVAYTRRHTAPVIYCCGNELLMDDPFVRHIERCGAAVHAMTDSLFSPMSAMRGCEYVFSEKNIVTVDKPIRHNPARLKWLSSFCDLYSSYAVGRLSYDSLSANPAEIDSWSDIYGKPRVSHEICIDGTYTDLSLKDRYRNTRIGDTKIFSSIEAALADKGLLDRAPLYYRNSCEWQRRVRKHCFEAARRCDKLAGFDFLGDINTHWHTFGYSVGMMNEFYELKPGETVRNVRMYNSDTVVLNDFGTDVNFTCGEKVECGLYSSNFSGKLEDAVLRIRLSDGSRVLYRRSVKIGEIENGGVSRLCTVRLPMPDAGMPVALRLNVTLSAGEVEAENEWELYAFPKPQKQKKSPRDNLLIADGMTAEELAGALASGRDVLLFGAGPFSALPTSFRIALAGRTSGNLATVIADHPALEGLPHEGFCGWQFRRLLEGGSAVQLEGSVPFHPIVEVVSTHKFIRRQAALFEYRALNGRLLVCSFRFGEKDPAARWLRARLTDYARSDAFAPADTLTADELNALFTAPIVMTAANTNYAMNPNDKTMKR